MGKTKVLKRKRDKVEETKKNEEVNEVPPAKRLAEDPLPEKVFY